MKKYCILILIIFSSSFSQPTLLLDQLGIHIQGTGRQFAYTNKEAGTYYGEVSTQNIGGWHGWYVNAQKILNDYVLTLDNKKLERTTATIIVFPHQLKRIYTNGIAETFTFLDSINGIVVEVSSQKTLPAVSIELSFLDEFIQIPSSDPNVIIWKKKEPPLQRFVPSWIAQVTVQTSLHKVFLIVAAISQEELEKNIEVLQKNYSLYIKNRKERMERFLQQSELTTNIPQLTTALAWAKLSLDALIMNQTTDGVPTKGIFAGLPWFNNYWGRDSFISLPGATFVLGNFYDAQTILYSFAQFQEKDSVNANYGRIPNLATPTSVTYNTADGTPWFVKSLFEYVQYSNDTAILKNLYPVVKRSVEGTIKFHTDSLGFLVHGDAETWMDAVGANGAWSPRGNRACDVQALWYLQLQIGAAIAGYMKEYNFAARWLEFSDFVKKNFNKYFIDKKNNVVYDHLKPNGLPATEFRPNQLFCLDIIESQEIKKNVVEKVVSNLVYEYGTSTLAQTDSNFHPFHHYEPHYVQDAAYHNGIVWTWLNGETISALTQYNMQDVGYAITKNMVEQILTRGCIGTLSELLDAYPRDGEKEPRLSGTFSQAWSLAEMLRGFYQDYLGISVDARMCTIRLDPKLPKELTDVECTIRVGDARIFVHYKWDGENISVSLSPKNLKHNFTVHYAWVYGDGNTVSHTTELVPEKSLKIVHSPRNISVFHNNEKIFYNNTIILRNNSPKEEHFTSLNLAKKIPNLFPPSLQGPSYPLLTLEQVREENDLANTLFDVNDVSNDDSGESQTYTYPTNINFQNGIFDITRFVMRYDKRNVYFSLFFRNLSNPGWHPEYGFQLTFATIAIQRNPQNKATEIGFNSHYRLSPERAFDRLVIVGGGVRLVDEKYDVLCEYFPQTSDAKNPIGNTKEKTVQFSIPLHYIGTPESSWKITVLTGGQDDHGGAGIGDFRDVKPISSEWVGGGKNNASLSNIYDFLLIN